MYKKDIRFEYRDILKTLFESQNGLQVFSLYSKLGIEPEVILGFIDKYAPQGFINVTDKDTRISLSEKGRTVCQNEIKELEQSAGFAQDSFLWKLRFPAINKYEPYVPTMLERNDDFDTF